MKKLFLSLCLFLCMLSSAWAYTDEEAKIIAMQGIEELVEIKNIVNDGSFGGIFPVVGMGKLLNWIPYTNGAKLEEIIDSMEYKIAFLRSYESQIPLASEAAKNVMIGSVGRLDTSLSSEAFLRVADRIHTFFAWFIY